MGKKWIMWRRRGRVASNGMCYIGGGGRSVDDVRRSLKSPDVYFLASTR